MNDDAFNTQALYIKKLHVGICLLYFFINIFSFFLTFSAAFKREQFLTMRANGTQWYLKRTSKHEVAIYLSAVSAMQSSQCDFIIMMKMKEEADDHDDDDDNEEKRA